MIESGVTYLLQDRRIALARGEELPERVEGTALLADMSGFTPLTAALTQSLGPRRGSEAMTAQITGSYDVRLGVVERFGGSVVGFAGAAVLCWFAARPLSQGGPVVIGLKTAVASGAARRFTVGEPTTQLIDILAGAPLARPGAGEPLTQRGEVVVDAPTADRLRGVLRVGEGREEGTGRYGVGESLLAAAPEAPLPAGPAPDAARSRA